MAVISFQREIKKWPAYNPWMIELAMHSRGLSITELSRLTKISRDKIRMLIAGRIRAEGTHIKLLSEALDYPESFFEQFPLTKLTWDGGCIARNENINYLAYPIFS